MLALIAGTGSLPGAIAHSLTQNNIGFMVCEMRGFPVEGIGQAERITFRIEHLGSLIENLLARGVTDICFAGAVRRPEIDVGEIDAPTLPLVPRVMKALQGGDDGALRIIMSLFEERGFAIRAAHELAADLLPPAGMLVGAPVDRAVRANLAAAILQHRALSSGDIGQAVVARDGAVVASEGPDGTDALLRSLSDPKDTGLMDDLVNGAIDGIETLLGGGATQDGGLLFKAPKIGQDRRADLPVIGPQTVMLCAQANIQAIVIEAGGVMVLDQTRTTELARAFDMRLWVRDAEA